WEYAPAPESRDIVTIRPEYGLFVGGEFVAPRSGEHFATVNPASEEPLASVAQAGQQDVDRAVAAAREACDRSWGTMPGRERAKYLYRIARVIQERAREFAVLESLDNGKPIKESRDVDVPLAAAHFFYHAGWADKLGYAGFGPDPRPVGVAGQVIPWNFPLLMAAWKLAPALATGNTCVLKPAETTPLSALLLAEVIREAGLPPGTVNIVTGDGRTGRDLVAHPGVDKIAFTGSTEVGRTLRTATAGSGKRLSLELGGKSPFVVFEDADLDSVVEGVVDAIWFNQGQVCCAGSRILAQESIAAELERKLKARMETLRVGSPLDKTTDIGAIVAPVQLETIRGYCEKGTAEGATCWQPSTPVPTEGSYFPPTLFTNVQPAATIAQEEIFGPVVVMLTFRTPEEAVALANNTRYGLAASVWSESLNLALDVAPKIKAGTVWVNCTNVFDAASGFGGYRESGYGREGGREGLFEYVRPEWEAVREPEPERQPEPEAAARAGGLAPADVRTNGGNGSAPPIDRTAKLYVGGKQARPDSGYSMPVVAPNGALIGEVGLGNRKDIRNAVEAAHKAAGWAKATAHLRAQVLYYIGENLAAREREFAERLRALTGASTAEAAREVQASIERLFTYAAWADKWDGYVHHTPFRNVTLAMPEPIGVMGVVCPATSPLLGFISTVVPPVAIGNTVVAIPSEAHPLAATDLYQVFDTSDLPGGVINIVTGHRDELAQVLAAHDDVDAVWYFGSREGSGLVERLSVGNMKRTWVDYGHPRDWFSPEQSEGPDFLREATQVKNIWVPYGE
ncbi:MAG TPA: aldehyde dehydrogenase family protein, partial [Longimicrobiales bacterium]